VHTVAWTSPIRSSWGVRLVGHVSPQTAPSGIVTPRNTLFLGPSPLIIPNGISVNLDAFAWSQMLYVVQCIVNGEENPQNCLFPLGFRHPVGGRPSHGHRKHAHKLAKIARVVPEISSRTDSHADRHTNAQKHTHRRTHHNTSHRSRRRSNNTQIRMGISCYKQALGLSQCCNLIIRLEA